MTTSVQKQYINRHKSYIDYRISILKNYVSLASSPKATISILIKNLISKNSHNSLYAIPLDCKESYEELNQLINSWDILQDGDIVGYIYQELQKHTNKKKKGQFFTPPDIVSYLIKEGVKTNINEQTKILDPACGSGHFLISIFQHLMMHESLSSIPKEKRPLYIIKNMLFGYDIDPLAIMISKYNLSRIANCRSDQCNIILKNYLKKDDSSLFYTSPEKPKFDLIISNPPWGSILLDDEKKYYRSEYFSSKSGINTFTLFIERSYDYLTERGILAFLIPEAYLNIKAHRNSRQFVLNHFIIHDIAVWGERFEGVFAPAISIICNRETDRQKRQKHIIHINPEAKQKRDLSLLIPQQSFHRTTENIFNIKYSRKTAAILSIIEDQNCIYLKNNARFFLGIVTGNNEKFISTKKSHKFPDPILLGKDVSQYSIQFSKHYFKYDQTKLQQVAPQHLYLSKNKILYKFIGKKLTFALDTTGHYSLNNLNGFIPEYDLINTETILSILNSYVMQYFYSKKFFTIKVLRSNLESLPIKVINKESQKKLTLLTNDLTYGQNAKVGLCRENIEDIIFHEYGIRDREAHILTEILPN